MNIEIETIQDEEGILIKNVSQELSILLNAFLLSDISLIIKDGESTTSKLLKLIKSGTDYILKSDGV